MALSDAALNIGAAAIIAGFGYAQLHSAGAGSSGTSNLCSSARQAVSWGTPTAGDFDLASNIVFAGGASNGVIHSVTLWSASSGGTFGGEFILSGDTTFNVTGDYTVTGISMNGSAT